MHIRIISFLITIVILLMTNLVYGCIAITMFTLYFRRPYEILIITLSIDALFSGPSHVFPYVYTVYTLMILLIKIPVRKYLRFHE